MEIDLFFGIKSVLFSYSQLGCPEVFFEIFWLAAAENTRDLKSDKLFKKNREKFSLSCCIAFQAVSSETEMMADLVCK